MKNLENKVKSDIKLYFSNRMAENYENEENSVEAIIYYHVCSTNKKYEENLDTYYQNHKIKNLLIKNSQPRDPERLAQKNEDFIS